MSLERTLELSISLDNIKDQIAAFLYAVGAINDNEEIAELTFGKGVGYSLPGWKANMEKTEVVPLTIKLKSKQEGSVRSYYG